jgi:hypothetical protein
LYGRPYRERNLDILNPGAAARLRARAILAPVVMSTRPARDAGARVMQPRRLVVLVAGALALPFFLWDFRTYRLAFAAVNAIAILVHPVFGALLVLSMWPLPTGVAGMVSARRRLATNAAQARL